jgi:hypothetical protein
MYDKIRLVQGDTRPQIKVVLTDEHTGAVVNITDATCLLKFRASGSTQLLDTLTGVVTNGLAGEVVFLWNPTSLDVDPGDYEGEIEVTFPLGAGRQTVYDLLKFRLRGDF